MASHGQDYLPSCPWGLNDVVVGLGGLAERILTTDNWTQPTSFHPCEQQRRTLLLLFLREEEGGRTCVKMILTNWSTVSGSVFLSSYHVMVVRIGRF